MFKNIDLVIITIILVLITIILGVELFQMNIFKSSLIVTFSLLSIPLYKGCLKNQKELNKNTFWRKYWYDMECKLPIIFYGVVIGGFIAWLF